MSCQEESLLNNEDIRNYYNIDSDKYKQYIEDQINLEYPIYYATGDQEE